MRNWTIPEIRLRNKEAGGHFFDRETIAFFNSRISETTYGRYFVTSEQFVASDGEREPRRYTIRRFNEDHTIDTVGSFQQYEKLTEALLQARRLAKAEDDKTVTV